MKKLKKLLLYAGVILAILITIPPLFVAPKDEAIAKTEESVELQEKERKNDDQKASPKDDKLSKNIPVIPGIMPVDVYLNFDERGFKTKKTYNPDGNLFESKLTDDGVEYSVTAFSRVNNKVESITGLAMIMEYHNDANDLKPFIDLLTTLPIKNFDNSSAKSWLAKNYNNHQATYTDKQSQVKLTMIAPTQWVRELMFEATSNIDR